MARRLRPGFTREEDEEDDEFMLMLGAVWYLFIHKKKHRSMWTRQWLLRRTQYGAYETLLSELRREDEGSFLNFLRVAPDLFDSLVERVRPLVQKEHTNFRAPISPGLRLAITLRYLATGK